MSKGNKKKKPKSLSWQKEAALVAMIAIFTLLFISNFGVGGKIGNAISSFTFGIVGIASYVMPLILIFISLFLISNRDNKIAWMKGIATLLALVFFTTFVEVVLYSNQPITLKAAYLNGFEFKEGGGVLGAAFANLLISGFGIIGGYVVSIAGMIISILLVTEKALFSLLKNKGKQVHEGQLEQREEKEIKKTQRREEQKSRHEERERRQEERERRQEELDEMMQIQEMEENKKLRMDQKVSGVAINTKLSQEQNQNSIDEMAEINFSGEYSLDEIDVDSPLNEVFVEKPQPEPVKTRIKKMGMDSNFKANTTPPTESNIESNKESNTESKINPSLIKPNKVNSEHYIFPPIRLLKKGVVKNQGESTRSLKETARKLELTLKNFGVNVTVTNVSCGPSVTRFEIQPEQGVKVSKIVALADDIKLNLAAADIRIEAPIPGKAAVGIEVPNKENVVVMLRDLIESDAFVEHKSKIAFAAGKDIGGNVIVSDIGKMPHVLIAGATGSGKSVCINTIIMSILYRAKPSEVKLIMIDPKVVELSVYNGIPHLMIPVVTDPKKAAGALHWAVAEMTERYQKFAQANVRDLAGYNEKVQKTIDSGTIPLQERMPQIVIIVDELADLMMVAPGEVEEAICRLAQLARAAGIHLILATQRPSVNVITGLIKANMPSRVSFAVSSGVDSRTILDMNGAEKLLGKGDMLFYPQGYQKPLRVQGAFISDEEVTAVVEFLSLQHPETTYNADIENKLNNLQIGTMSPGMGAQSATEDDRDIYFEEAGILLIEKERGSIGMLQRVFKIGFNRAARIMDQLQEAGVVGPEEGTKPRKILLTMEEFQEIIEQNRDI